jgi:hypothetical protein
LFLCPVDIPPPVWNHVSYVIPWGQPLLNLPAANADQFSEKYPVFMRGALFLAWFVGVFFVVQKAYFSVITGRLGWDAHAYWLAGHGDLSYTRSGGEIDAYLYSPAFATAIRPLAAFDWPVFYIAWIILQSAVAMWLLKPIRLRWAIPIFLTSVPEIVNGNIFVLLAACAVLGVKRPGVLAFPLLTKITSGVGLIWFVARGEWTYLARALSVTFIVATVSYLMAPTAWQAWLEFLYGHRDGTPDGVIGFTFRCLVAGAIVVFGARKGQPWLIAPAMVLASPIFDFPVLTILTAIPRLLLPTAVAMHAPKPETATR